MDKRISCFTRRFSVDRLTFLDMKRMSFSSSWKGVFTSSLVYSLFRSISFKINEHLNEEIIRWASLRCLTAVYDGVVVSGWDGNLYFQQDSDEKIMIGCVESTGCWSTWASHHVRVREARFLRAWRSRGKVFLESFHEVEVEGKYWQERR
jgi:hypothetical protein